MGAEAARQLEAIARELVKAGKKARRRGKARDWHRLRTTSRRMRGALDAFPAALDPALQPRLARRAKKITRLPGDVRDLDVALGYLRLLRDAAQTRGERRSAREMLRRLHRERDRQERRLRRKLARKRPAQRLTRQLKKALRHPPPPAPVTEDAGARAETTRVVLERMAEIGGWEEDEKLHALRVAVKKHRAALTAWVEAHPGHLRQHRPILEALQKAQGILGEHHDWSELAGRLDQRRRKLSNHGARHRELVGYEALLGRARQEQRARYESYRTELHERLSTLLTAEPARAREGRSIFEMIAANG
jgi:CHAD domain-containing protein